MMRILPVLLLLTLQSIGQKEGVNNTLPVLKVAVYDAAPFGFLYPDSTFGGLMVEIWEDIASELNWQYEYYQEDMEGLLSGLEAREYDVGIGAISITPKREARVDFSQAVNPSGTGIAEPASKNRNVFLASWAELLVSLLELVGILLIVLFFSGTLVWLVERNTSTEEDENSIRNIADGLWWSAVTMTTVGYGDKVPHSSIGKILGIVWIFTSIILLSLFTANASAILSDARREATIRSIEDLRRVEVGAAAESSGQEFLLREHIEHQAYHDVTAALDAMMAGDIDCVVSNMPVLQYLNHSDKRYINRLALSRSLLLKNNMGIALQEESPLREAIDLILLEKIIEPKWQDAVYKYLGEVE